MCTVKVEKHNENAAIYLIHMCVKGEEEDTVCVCLLCGCNMWCQYREHVPLDQCLITDRDPQVQNPDSVRPCPGPLIRVVLCGSWPIVTRLLCAASSKTNSWRETHVRFLQRRGSVVFTYRNMYLSETQIRFDIDRYFILSLKRNEHEMKWTNIINNFTRKAQLMLLCLTDGDSMLDPTCFYFMVSCVFLCLLQAIAESEWILVPHYLQKDKLNFSSQKFSFAPFSRQTQKYPRSSGNITWCQQSNHSSTRTFSVVTCTLHHRFAVSCLW